MYARVDKKQQKNMFIGTKNFSRAEFEYSNTANKYKIDNTLPISLESQAQRLLIFLQGIRDAWGSGIKITSGYRCKKLNRFVGGSATSSHITANGADLVPVNGKMDEFKKFIVGYMKNKMFDQCIIEKSGDTEWIHIGLYNSKGQQRKMVFNIIK